MHFLAAALARRGREGDARGKSNGSGCHQQGEMGFHRVILSSWPPASGAAPQHRKAEMERLIGLREINRAARRTLLVSSLTAGTSSQFDEIGGQLPGGGVILHRGR